MRKIIEVYINVYFFLRSFIFSRFKNLDRNLIFKTQKKFNFFFILRVA